MIMLPPFLRYLPQQFSPLSALRIGLVDLLRRVLDPSARLSYSSSGEDVVLRNYFSSLPSGYYVDVGCNQPDSTSNTFALYKAGWRGLCIDADARLIQAQKKLRPRDQQVQAVISDVEEEVTFTRFDNDQISSISAEYLDFYHHDRTDRTLHTMRARTLTNILEAMQVPEKFELLSIDVEGHDFQALRSLNFSKYRPSVVLIEILDMDLAHHAQNDVCSFMLAQGYKLVGYLYQNAYFIERGIIERREILRGVPLRV
jgi:FkbM family methyltransferase